MIDKYFDYVCVYRNRIIYCYGFFDRGICYFYFFSLVVYINILKWILLGFSSINLCFFCYVIVLEK